MPENGNIPPAWKEKEEEESEEERVEAWKGIPKNEVVWGGGGAGRGRGGKGISLGQNDRVRSVWPGLNRWRRTCRGSFCSSPLLE